MTKDESDQPWQTAGHFFKAVAEAGMNRKIDPRLYAVKAPTGLGELIPSDGGYLVPPQYAAGIRDATYQSGSLLSLVARDAIQGNRMIYNAVDETSRADGSRQGGILGYWVAEAGSITASHPTFRQVDLKLHKVAALVYASDEMLADVGALTSYLARAVPNELKFLIEDAIINGNGIGKPLGILKSNALYTYDTRDNAGHVTYTDLVNMWAHRFVSYKDYVWLVNPTVMPEISIVTLTNSYAPPRYIEFGPDGVLRMFGRPVLEMEQCPLIGHDGDILLISPSQYQTIDKGGVESASSIHVNFVNDETAFRFTYRIDGASMWSAGLTPYGGSATDCVSPFVALTSATT